MRHIYHTREIKILNTNLSHEGNQNIEYKFITRGKEKLLASVAETKFVVYDNYVPNLENENTCLESLQELEKAKVGSRRRIVYFSCLQGEE